jgi:hypothetical protein
MFMFLGIAVGMYTAYASWTGTVYARSRFSGSRAIVRDESPVYFWTVIACYALLSVALMTVF